MTPHRSLPLFSLLLMLVAFAASPALADPAKTLEEAGLERSGLEYVIEEETEIIRGRREIQLAERELKSAEKDFRDAERKIARAQRYIAGLQREMEEMKDRVRRSDDQNEYARNMKAYEELVDQIERAQEERKEFEKEQQVKLDDARAEYISTMVQWVEKSETVLAKYKKLAENEAVTDAIEELSNQDRRRYVLGPSRRFEAIQRQLAQAAEEYQRGAVDLRKKGNVMEIDVRVNGKPIRSMILDTGASAISLPYMFAKDLGIEASDTDPTVQLQMADGKIVDAKKVSLESVQVGEFIVNDVEAFVLPENLTAASPLLGNSFLGNFTYEIDPDRGKLILSRLKKEN